MLGNTAFFEVHRTCIFDIKSAAEVRSDSKVDVFVGNLEIARRNRFDFTVHFPLSIKVIYVRLFRIYHKSHRLRTSFCGILAACRDICLVGGLRTQYGEYVKCRQILSCHPTEASARVINFYYIWICVRDFIFGIIYVTKRAVFSASASTTVTLHLVVLLSSFVVTVIVASPSFTPFTLPLLSTVAM